MLENYFSLFVMIVLASAITGGLILFSIICGPKQRSAIKEDSFECGTVGSDHAGQRFGVKYLAIAIIFVVFDVELVFLYPWALQLFDTGWPAFWLALPFILTLEIALLFVWRRGALDWLR